METVEEIGSKFTQDVREEILRILAKERISREKGFRLLHFLDRLRSGEFITLSSIKKKALFETFLDLIQYKKEEPISQICHLVFASKAQKGNTKSSFPEEMMEALVKSALNETAERVRGMLWGFLLKRGAELVKTVRPDEFVFGLWSVNPVTRNTFIRFLLKNFGIDEVMEAIVREAAKRGMPVPVMAFDRLLAAGKGEGLRHKKTLLLQIITGSDLSEEETERVWSKYLLSLSRFDLVRIFREEGGGIESPKRGGPQQSFSFKARPHMGQPERDFHWRTMAIRQL
jgi:hypothetical protein